MDWLLPRWKRHNPPKRTPCCLPQAGRENHPRFFKRFFCTLAQSACARAAHIFEYQRDDLSPEAASALKLHTRELMGRVADQCLQLFGGHGYMAEYPRDARVLRIYGDTLDRMKKLVARGLLGR